MQFRIQFLDRSATVVRELAAEAQSAACAFELIAGSDWPPDVVSVQVLDGDGFEVLTAWRWSLDGPKQHPL